MSQPSNKVLGSKVIVVGKEIPLGLGAVGVIGIGGMEGSTNPLIIKLSIQLANEAELLSSLFGR